MGIEILKTKRRKARKEHTCDYCGCKIEKGEVYNRSTCKWSDSIYDWACHQECSEVVSFLDAWIDADEYGIDGDMFCDACREFCQTFICPTCKDYGKEDDECNQDKSYCIDKIYAISKTHKLVRSKGRYGIAWELGKVEVPNEKF